MARFDDEQQSGNPLMAPAKAPAPAAPRANSFGDAAAAQSSGGNPLVQPKIPEAPKTPEFNPLVGTQKSAFASPAPQDTGSPFLIDRNAAAGLSKGQMPGENPLLKSPSAPTSTQAPSSTGASLIPAANAQSSMAPKPIPATSPVAPSAPGSTGSPAQQNSFNPLMGPPSTMREVSLQQQQWRGEQRQEMNDRYNSAGAQMAQEARDMATMRMNRANAPRSLVSPVVPTDTKGTQMLAGYDAVNPLIGAKPAPAPASNPLMQPWDMDKLGPKLGGLDREFANQASLEKLRSPEQSSAATTDGKPAAAPAINREGKTNALVGELNPQGRVQAVRQANGTISFSGDDVGGAVSYTNGAGNPLMGGGLNGKGFSRVDSAPAGANVAMDGNGNYAFSENPLMAGVGTTRPSSGATNPLVSGALDAAAARGDFNALAGYYASQGQGFGGQSADQIKASQSGPQGRVMNVGTLGFDPATRNANWESDKMMNVLMNPNASRAQQHAAANALNTVSENTRSANRLVSEERRADASNQTGLMQTAMRDGGDTMRANQRNALTGQELQIRQGDSDRQGKLTDAQLKDVERKQGITAQFDALKTDEERSNFIQRHPDVFGVKTQAPQGKDRFITTGGGTSVVDGQTVKEPTRVFDTVSQKYVGEGTQAQQPLDKNPQAIAIRDNKNLSFDQKKAELAKLGYTS